MPRVYGLWCLPAAQNLKSQRSRFTQQESSQLVFFLLASLLMPLCPFPAFVRYGLR